LQEKQVALLPKLKESVRTPEGVPRLFDLIKVQDERMKLAFFAAMGNTVVAKDLDQVISSFFVTLRIILLISN
jgi:structural maintenance of chromosome 4